jgi:ATP-binding cassette subfamily C protein CydC
MTIFLRLLKLIAPFKWWVALSVLLSFLTIGSSVGLMAMSAYLISKAAIVTDIEEIALAITTVRVFAISRALFRYLERYITHRSTFRVLAHLRVWFYESIEPLAPARLVRDRSGDLLARVMGDIETLQNFYVRVIVPPMAAVLVTIFACLLLGAFDFSLAIALLAFLLLTGVALPLVSRRLSTQPAAELVSAHAELNANLVDSVQGVADLLAFDYEGRHQARVLALSKQLNRSQERMAAIRGASNALAALFTGLAGITVLMLAIPLVTGGKLDGVYLALLPLTAIAAFEAVQPLSLALHQLEVDRAAGRRLFELVEEPPVVDGCGLMVEGRPATGDRNHQPSAINPQPSTPAPAIDIRNLSFSYAPGEAPALDDVSLATPAGGRVAVVGPSGAGKSTLVNMLLRFWDYGEGQIDIGGRELHEYDADEVRQMIGVVPQSVYLFNATVEDNLLLANPDATHEQIVAACSQAELHDFIQSLPQGYDTIIGENGLLLSGGERQRLAIARVILKDAPILILDEATANLDALTERKIMQSLEPFMSGRTVLIISHRSAAIEHADETVALDRGQVSKT